MFQKSKDALKAIIKSLRPGNRFKIIYFAADADGLELDGIDEHESGDKIYEYNNESIQAAISEIDKIEISESD